MQPKLTYSMPTIVVTIKLKVPVYIRKQSGLTLAQPASLCLLY